MPTDIAPIERIIWSADISDEGALMDYLDLMPDLKIVKIDRLFVTDSGLGVIDRLNERGLQVFDDAKIIEIPSKLVGIAKKHLRHKPFMLNCMAGAVSSGVLSHEESEKIDGLKRFADACLNAGTKPCAVTVLTSKTPLITFQEFHGCRVADQVLYYLEQLLKCGFTDVVCSPNEVAAIRAESRFDVLDLNTPGIRPAGATRLVIGRPITQGDPTANLENIVAGITAAA